MSGEKLKTAAVATVAMAAVAGAAGAAKATEIDKLIAKIQKGNDEERGEAWQGAWRYGSPAISRLAELMSDENFEVVRAAKRGIWKIVRHAGRPGADNEKQATIKALLPLMNSKNVELKREVMWMLSEVAGDEAVAPVAAMLKDKELREDARMVLRRLPGRKSLQALKNALKTVPADFKINIAQSLRARGVKVPGLPCQKMVPTRKTTVKPIG